MEIRQRLLTKYPWSYGLTEAFNFCVKPTKESHHFQCGTDQWWKGWGREKVSQYHLKSLHCLKLKISGCVSVLHRISSWIASLDSGSLDVVLCVAQDQQGCDIAAQKPGKRSRWCSNTPCKPAAAQCLVKNPSSESLFTQRRTRPWYMGLKSAWDVRAVTVFIKASLCLEAESL